MSHPTPVHMFTHTSGGKAVFIHRFITSDIDSDINIDPSYERTDPPYIKAPSPPLPRLGRNSLNTGLTLKLGNNT